MYRRYAVILGGIFVAALPPVLAGQTPSTSSPPQISTTGVGEASAVPDRATIYIAVQTRAATATAASADNARRVKAVMDTLRAIGVSGDQVQTANYSVTPEAPYMPSTTPKTVTYAVSNSLLVKLRRIEEVGRVIDAALGKGANEISSLQFSSSTVDSVRSLALAAAVVDAKTQAEAMARAAGDPWAASRTKHVYAGPPDADGAVLFCPGCGPDADHSWRTIDHRDRECTVGLRSRTLTRGPLNRRVASVPRETVAESRRTECFTWNVVTVDRLG